ncbi:guanine nucleotide exchange factor DBS-like isoform X2 [Halichondria panicea]|uniref:guanine nucleotide exchange factor DBS-like isoform X2 n=1 Tax=Halichondria panicea TaxID=6063 RepID=UPI00312B5243
MATGGIAQSMSVSDRRRLFELNSGKTGSSNAIHDSLRKTKPTLTKRVSSPNITVRATTTTSTSEPTDTRPAKKSSIFSRKNSASNSASKKVNRASSDADVLESKRSKYQSSKMGDSPKHSKSNETSPTHSESKSSSKKRREAPRPPSQVVSPQESPKHRPQESPKHRPPDSPIGHKELKQDGASSSGKSKAERPPRPPSPKRVVRDKDLEITLSDGTQMGGDVLKKVLSKQLAYLAGGLEEDKHPILTIPDVGLRLLDAKEAQADLTTTILYIKTLLSADQLSCGVTLLLDSRSSKTHSATKIILEKISVNKFPVSVHMVYVYIKTGLFSRSKNLASPDVIAKLHMAYLPDQKSLLDQFEPSNVPDELGGSLKYDHKSWVYNRLEFEKMQHLYQRAKTRFPDVRDALDLVKVPTCVKEAEHIMTEDLKLKEGLVNRLAEAELSIDNFLDVLKHQVDQGSLEISLGTKDYITMMSALNGMLEDIRNTMSQFDKFWGVHKARVDHMMRMCHFNRSADKSKHLMQGHIDDLKSGGLLLGDTLESSLELGEKHEAFVSKCKSTMDEHMDRIRADANILINPTFEPKETDDTMHSATKEAITLVQNQLDNLTTTYQELMTLCQQKRDLFIVCVKFHMTTRQCQQWTQDALEFMASQPLEEPSSKIATDLVRQIDGTLNRVNPNQLTAMIDLAAALPPEKQYSKNAHKTSQKFEQARELLNNRKGSLQKILSIAAVQSNSTSNKAKSFKKNKITHSEIEIVNGNNSEPLSITSPAALDNPEASLYLAKTMASVTEEYTDGESSEAVIKSRNNVYRELVETEKVYIKDMQTVMDAYYDAMDPESVSIPLRLRGKRDAVFGNILDIYKFHDSVFSKALDRYADQPERMGECFIQFTQEFQMYSDYCKNRSNSETLVNEGAECQAFFKGIQRNLAHALDLNAYLLRPVQRITKYQLLLKDMMKHSSNAPKAYSDLQMALDRMLKVLKNLNDSLHVVGLKGFPGALAEQGRLLVHDAFNVWDSGASVSRSLFSRGHERHVFLFEKVIIFSKKIEASEEKKRVRKSDAYLYKGHLELTDIALKDSIDTQPLQFILTVHGQQKIYKFLAQTKVIHTMWTNEIRRLLQVQFTLMKDKVIKSGTLDRKSYKGKTKLSTHQRDSRLFASIKEESPKKSISNRFNLFKRNKKGDQKKPLKSSTSLSGNPESSLVASCSVPPSLKYSIGGKSSRRASNEQASLSKSSIESARSTNDYCKNRSNSETLVNEGAECQAFFKGIQRNLAHALDLNAYLLRPSKDHQISATAQRHDEQCPQGVL